MPGAPALRLAHLVKLWKRRNMFSGIPNETWLVIANTARNGATILAAFAACVTMLAALWQFEVQKRVNTAKDERAAEMRRASDERIAAANAAAETARAEAAQAKLETVEVSERLLLTQERLDEANRVTPLTDDQVDIIVKGLVKIRLTDTQRFGLRPTMCKLNTGYSRSRQQR